MIDDDIPYYGWARRRGNSASPERRIQRVIEQLPAHLQVNLAMTVIELAFTWSDYDMYEQLNELRDVLDDRVLNQIKRDEEKKR